MSEFTSADPGGLPTAAGGSKAKVVRAECIFLLKEILDRHGVDTARRVGKIIQRFHEDPKYREAIGLLVDLSGGDAKRMIEILREYQASEGA